MIMRIGWIISVFVTLVVLGNAVDFAVVDDAEQSRPYQTASAGDPATLRLAYESWKSRQPAMGADRQLVVPLAYSKARSVHFTSAQGQATIDLVTGALSVDLTGAEGEAALDLWLIDAQGAGSERAVRLGALTDADASGYRSLQSEIDGAALAGMHLDRLVVARADQDMAEGSLLFGTPSLFQRLYYNEVTGAGMIRAAGAVEDRTSPWMLPFAALVPSPAYADAAADLAALVAEGEDLFNNETFAGNGRTCATCHPANNNFTIDPDFIATLRKRDPLFIAENNNALRDLENPVLMRQFGLILANVDGLDDPTNKFVMRSVPHLFGMSVSIQSNATEAPFQMTGWSGDGAPGAGRLRDFSTGAVTQHFPLSLNRIAGVDFRLPTEAELDAMEAFMLSLGRQADPDIAGLRLLDVNAERGRKLFLAEDSQGGTVPAAKCNICHGNAGALTVAGLNPNFITDTEEMLHAADLTGEPRPRDDGFGQEFNPATGGFGDGSFNPPSLVEAADTGPYFHHNAAETLEDAIAHYDSREFRDSIEGQRLLLQDTGGREMAVEVDALAAFLRVVNVLDNLDAATGRIARAMLESKRSGAKPILKLALVDIDDAANVLVEGDLHEFVWEIVATMRDDVEAAIGTRKAGDRNAILDDALAQAAAAVDLMVDSAGPVADITPPTVAILAPMGADTVVGSISFSASATDDTSVANVVFKANGMMIGQDATAPYSLLWDTTASADGAMTLTATATDLSGNSATDTVGITIDNASSMDATPPTVAILSPADGATVLGNIIVSADASDDDAVDMVVFKIDATEFGQSLVAPYEQTLATSGLANGAHVISATAVDLSGNAATHSITITVDNPPCTVYSCPNPPQPPSDPPPDPDTPDGTSPDGEFESVALAIDLEASTITVDIDGDQVTLQITNQTVFNGSIATALHEILVGHVVQGEFFSSTNEVVWIEADMPPGL